METAVRSWRALGTSVHVLVSDPAGMDAAVEVVRDVLARVDATYSRFRPDSELSRLNARAGGDVVVTALLATALESALRAARLTDGAVDPTIGRALRMAGYDVDFDQVRARLASGEDDGSGWRPGDPMRFPAPTFESVPGWRAVRFDRAARIVRAPVGVELDLGSTGKALAADLAAAQAAFEIGGGVLVSLGGDIATAGEAPPAGWQVLVAESHETPPDSEGEVLALPGGAVATSGTTTRRWTRGGVTRHHLIDPATGQPARSLWRTATVLAATCVDANTAATAAIIKSDQAPAWLEDLGFPARLVAVDGAIRRVGPWPVRMSEMPVRLPALEAAR